MTLTLGTEYDVFVVSVPKDGKVLIDQNGTDKIVVLGNQDEAEHVLAAVNWYEAFHGTIEKRRAETKAAGQ